MKEEHNNSDPSQRVPEGGLCLDHDYVCEMQTKSSYETVHNIVEHRLMPYGRKSDKKLIRFFMQLWDLGAKL
jgi:hypothetical protein